MYIPKTVLSLVVIGFMLIFTGLTIGITNYDTTPVVDRAWEREIACYTGGGDWRRYVQGRGDYYCHHR